MVAMAENVENKKDFLFENKLFFFLFSFALQNKFQISFGYAFTTLLVLLQFVPVAVSSLAQPQTTSN